MELRSWTSLCRVSTPYASVSIVCVYNHLTLRQQCLDRSIEALRDEASDVEYLPIENESGTYKSAGSALNHGVSLAKNDVVVFVHQDVFLHSLTALKRAAGQLRPGGFGLLGAAGIGTDNRLIGRIRDRVMITGEAVSDPVEVDTVDEVLFMAPRIQLASEPLTEANDLAWHAYAVEYGLRVRRQGLRTGVADIPLTHNSLSVNLARLDSAHQAIAALYADLLPVRTSCGMITGKTVQDDGRGWLASQRWRYRWLRDSIVLQEARMAAGRTAGVLADIRHDIDDLIERAPGKRLYVVNCSDGQRFTNRGSRQLELSRRDGTAVFRGGSISDVPAMLASSQPGSWLLVTNLSAADIKTLDRRFLQAQGILGLHRDTGLWLLFGARFTDLPPLWRSRRATPLGMRTHAARAVS
jgi:hypothetical protein